uniref:NAC domain-containing protein 41-like n=1 Tax=Erigeron canadensis TaxID=72917 RepID=UPI001CB9C086|nr:NAC domain-containing protein 41-like [Erigeron canadensis]
MCPSSCIPLAEEYWTDEGIFMSLLDFKNGKPLPSNVTSDVNPYLYRPSDLPADLWYCCSGEKADAECGFWQETGEACEIFSNSSIRGFRTTLQFYEGRVPHGRKTDWMMQEYRITEKCNKQSKDSRVLCRVFLAGETKSSTKHCIANIDVKISINLGSETFVTSELPAKAMDKDTGPSLLDRRTSDPFLENDSEMDCILLGDYMELNDLVNPRSHSSSSANSSCLTMTSDEYFDSIALLKELEEDIRNQETKDSSVRYNLSAPIKSTEVVIHTATSVSLINDQASKSSAQGTSIAVNKSTSNGGNKIKVSSSSSKCISNERRKECVGRKTKRKIMKYLCFL